jgi:hypothetical protein
MPYDGWICAVDRLRNVCFAELLCGIVSQIYAVLRKCFADSRYFDGIASQIYAVLRNFKFRFKTFAFTIFRLVNLRTNFHSICIEDIPTLLLSDAWDIVGYSRFIDISGCFPPYSVST